MSSEVEKELLAYKKVCLIAEQLLENAQLPQKLMQKFTLIKALTIQKFQTNNIVEVSQEISLANKVLQFVDQLNTRCVDILNDHQGSQGFNHESDKFTFSDPSKMKMSLNELRTSSAVQKLEFELKNLMKNIVGIDDLAVSMRECIQALQHKVNYLELNTIKEKEQMEGLRLHQDKELQLENERMMTDLDNLSLSLEQQKETHRKENQLLKENYYNKIQSLERKLSELEENHATELEQMAQESKFSVEKLKIQVDKSQELLEYFQQFSQNFKSEFEQYHEKYFESYEQDFQEVFSYVKNNSFRRRVNSLIPSNIFWQMNNFFSEDEYMELLHFIVFLLGKFEQDNHWLVNKMKMFGGETQDLKEKLEIYAKKLNLQQIVVQNIEEIKSGLKDSEKALARFANCKAQFDLFLNGQAKVQTV